MIQFWTLWHDPVLDDRGQLLRKLVWKQQVDEKPSNQLKKKSFSVPEKSRLLQELSSCYLFALCCCLQVLLKCQQPNVAGKLAVEPVAVTFLSAVEQRVQKIDAEGITDRGAVVIRVSSCCFTVSYYSTTYYSIKSLKVQFWHFMFQSSPWLRKAMPDNVMCEDWFFFSMGPIAQSEDLSLSPGPWWSTQPCWTSYGTAVSMLEISGV